MAFAKYLVICGLLIAFPAFAAEKTVDKPALTESVIRSTAAKYVDNAQEVALYALSLIGVNYKFGGNSPDTGLDCSGLVRHVFQQVTGRTLPRSSREISRVGEKITLAELKPGDLVFFNTLHNAFSHVGIYLGDNRFIHSPRRGADVMIDDLDHKYWLKRFNGARRILTQLADDSEIEKGR